MKNFLKKMNRGVALAIVLIIGLMAFFVVDAVTFSQEEDAIKEFLVEYLEECAQVNLLSVEYRNFEAEIPDSVIDAKTKEIEDFVEKYYTEYKRVNSSYYYSTKSSILNNTNYMFTNNRELNQYVEELEYSLVNISSIQKQATNAVRVSFNVNIKMRAAYDASFLNISRIEWGLWNYFREYGNSHETDKIYEAYQEEQFTITLFKVNGKWKIAEADSNYYGGGGMVSTVRVG